MAPAPLRLTLDDAGSVRWLDTATGRTVPLVRGGDGEPAPAAEGEQLLTLPEDLTTAEFTGRWGVFDVGRMFNLSPDQVQQVSDHLPVWAEFSAYEAAAPGRVGADELAP